MKKILFASAFALIGTFALANETNKKDSEKKEEKKSENVEAEKLFSRQCTSVANNCGMALIYCWEGELDPDKLNNFVKGACSEEQDGPKE